MNNSLTRASLVVGATIANTYTIEGLLGKGGMGSVFLCSHARLPGKRVAIKVLHTEVANPEVLARFRREAEIASKLGHANIVTVLDFNSLDDGTPYLVLEYLVGEALAERMRQGRQSLDFTLSIARQVGSALAAAHREGIVHRDLKPQNIFLVATESQGRHAEVAKVLDFGISKIVGSATVQTQEHTMLGTPQYMSPEQATGRQADVDGRADQFALAVILHELLTGASAFPGSSIPEVVFKVVYEPPTPLLAAAPDTPPHVAEALARALQKDHTARFATIEEFVQALTGEALPKTRMGRASLATPLTATAVADPMAMTVDSGNHGPALGSASTTPAPTPPPSSVRAASISGMEHTVAAPSVVTAAPVLAAPPLNTLAPAVQSASASDNAVAPKRRVPGFVIAAGFGALAAIGGGVWVASRSHDTKTTPDAAHVAQTFDAAQVVQALDAAPIPDAMQVAMIPDAAPPRDAAPTPPRLDAAPPINKVKPPKPNPTGSSGSGSNTVTVEPSDPLVESDPVATELAAAQKALATHDIAAAKRHALRVHDSEAATPIQVNRALAVLVTLACDNSDLNSAASWYRQISRGPLRVKLRKACRQKGITLED